MKKYSLTVLLLILLWGFGSFCYAQSVVCVEQLGADYTVSTVSFRVYWDAAPQAPRHRDTVWLFVDYQPIAVNGSLGVWTPATLTNPAATSPGEVIAGSLNGRGFYLKGTPIAPFSSIVTVTLAGLSAGERFNWCAYVTDYPPNATIGAGFYELHGTPPFEVNSYKLAAGVRTYTGCITSLTDATGCPGLIPVSPAISSFIAQPDTICVGDTVTLTASASDATEYSFDDGSVWTTLSAATFTPSIIPTTEYIVKARNPAHCETKATVPVTVYPRPVAEFVNPPLTACAGSTVTLTASGGGSYCFTYACAACGRNPYATGNDVPTEYDCFIQNDSCTFSTTNTYQVTMPDTGQVTVRVRVINDNGCVDSASTTITITPPPPAPVLAASATYCTSSAAIPFTGVAGYSYQLQDNLLQGVGASTFGAGPLTLPITTTGAYTVVVTDAAGCTAVSNAQEATVAAAPTITLTTGNSSRTVTIGTAITKIQYATANATGATATGLPDGISESWVSDVYTLTGTPTKLDTFDYIVTTTNNNGCPDASANGTIVVAAGCIPATFSLGAVGFTSNDIYSRNGLIISSPVTATYCTGRCSSFDGGSSGAFKADCAPSSLFSGHLFSWCMVMQYADQLCPSPWRVPTAEDHCLLVNGSTSNYTGIESTFNNVVGYAYTGSALSGSCSTLSYGYYWSSSEHSDVGAYFLGFNSITTNPQTNSFKNYGFALRCVQDAP
ncbi:MAG: fibrobacter succinogenes major paralogous domain-containing protein [Prevotellaceae bacterium]|jgi:hypothetical protein|nr:fibrobacter succinogenes major paralogous domain-containing protein [Prevotellaceae bacterium]